MSSFIPKRVTTDTISKSFRRKMDIQHEVKQIVQRCEDCIEDAYDKDKETCEVPIPNTFSVNCADPTDAMLTIHSTVIMEMEARGFNVVIKPEPEFKRSILIFSGWKLLDNTTRSKMKEFIAARTDKDFKASVPRKKRIY